MYFDTHYSISDLWFNHRSDLLFYDPPLDKQGDIFYASDGFFPSKLGGNGGRSPLKSGGNGGFFPLK